MTGATVCESKPRDKFGKIGYGVCREMLRVHIPGTGRIGLFRVPDFILVAPNPFCVGFDPL